MQENKKVNFYIGISAIIAALAGLLLGFDTGIISGALLFIQKDFPVTTLMKEFIVSSVLAGAMAGTISCGRLTDLLGRRSIMLVIAVLFMIGTLLATFATDIQAILTGRLVIGFAIGIGSYAAPLYIAEISPVNLRGRLVTLYQLAITIGILFSYIINYVFTNLDGSWRWMFGIGLLPATLLAIGMFFLPESPRWLVMKNKTDIARATLKHLRQSNDVEHEISEIHASLTVKNAKFSEIFKPWIRPVLFLGMMLGFIQQVTGINTIIYYAPSIFTLAGFQDTSSTILATVGIGIVNVLATFIAVRYLDTIGRRPLLLAGLTGMGISLLVLSFAFKLGTDSSLLMWAAMACTFTYIITFAFSLGAILWVIVSEIFPLEVRATAMGVAMFSCFLWNFVVSSTFLTLLDAMGPANTFFMYASLCFLSLIFCYHKVPETKGVTLEQIEDNIRQGLPLRELGLPSTTMVLATKAS